MEFSSPPATDDAQSEVAAQINKRLTLNLLIQGAAAHMFVTASHLVRDELEEIQPGMTRMYDRFAISGQLNYCIGDNCLAFGRPNRWWGFSRTPQIPFQGHPFLAKYANRLAVEETRHLRKLAKPKRVIGIPFFHWLQFMPLLFKVLAEEKGHERELAQLAVRVATEIWDLPAERYDGAITREVAFGNLQPSNSFLAQAIRAGAVGYGGVERRGEHFVVVAKAWVFPLLVHELVKGTVELICLHGLGELADDVYQAVTDEADRLEYEAWLLQAGPAMWRRFIAVAPRNRRLAETVMHVARLEPEPLEKLMMQIMETPGEAARVLSRLGRDVDGGLQHSW